jgi:hypothetical protein
MDSGFTMIVHSIIITAILYVLMVYVLKQSVPVATDRSILIGATVLIYMTLYGHTFPPGRINPNILNL